jgi:multiple sugar transport system permease protein
VQQVRNRSLLARREALAFYGFISPWIIGFICFTGGPIIASLYFSLTNYTLLSSPHYIGLGNYTALFNDPLFSTSLYNTFYYTVFFVPLGIIFSFMLALLLNQKVGGLAAYRTVYYLPSIVPAVANSILWIWLLNPQWGLINTVLRMVGIEGPGWLTSEVWSKPAIILMSLWGVGSWVIIFLAGLQGVPEQYYEAAEVDGATTLARFFHITLPLMTPTIFFTLITGIIGALQVFTQAYIMTNGGPVNSTLFYSLYLFRNAFNYLKMGYAAAMAWILFVIILILTIIQFRLAQRWVFYE